MTYATLQYLTSFLCGVSNHLPSASLGFNNQTSSRLLPWDLSTCYSF
jgi:hypothetical protein